MITANTYFSGIGMLDIGLQLAGITIGQAFELDADACKTYRANHSHKLVEGDLAQRLVLEQDSCDIMAFTYPCTKYSRIADIHGTRTGDELFRLFLNIRLSTAWDAEKDRIRGWITGR